MSGREFFDRFQDLEQTLHALANLDLRTPLHVVVRTLAIKNRLSHGDIQDLHLLRDTRNKLMNGRMPVELTGEIKDALVRAEALVTTYV